MKRLIYILFFISLLFSSCEGYELQELQDDSCIILTVSNSAMTKVADNGAAYERRLNTLHFFFYPKGQTSSPCVFYHKEELNGNDTGTAEVKIFVQEDAISKIFPTEKTCEIFVIANLPDYLTPEDSNTFKDGSAATTLDVLQKYILKLDDENNPDYVPTHDGVEKPFVMAGLGTALETSTKNATGSVNLRRIASKVTISVAIPTELTDVPIVIDGNESTVTMVPALDEIMAVETMNTAFHNGNYKGYLYSDVDADVDNYYIDSSKKKFTYSHTLDAVYGEDGTVKTPERKVYNCDVPFYTYAREWEKGAADAAYMTFEMKWGVKGTNNNMIDVKTYYYQILINAPERSFEPNHWYDMFVNVGVIGSTIKLEPILIDHLALFVLDWSDTTSGVDHPDEDVVLDKYIYLHVDTPVLELNNKTSGFINYKASGDVKFKLAFPDETLFPDIFTTMDEYELLNANGDELSNFYLNSTGTSVALAQTPRITDRSFTKEKEKIKFENTILSTDKIASPVYAYLTIWLDLDGNNTLDENTDEANFCEVVKIIQYPAIYVLPDPSNLRSVYINGFKMTGWTDNDNHCVKYGSENLGLAFGVRNGDNQNLNYSMFTINVTAFEKVLGEDGEETAESIKKRMFEGPVYDDNGDVRTPIGDNNNHRMYEYIVGDPRQRSPEIFNEYSSTNATHNTAITRDYIWRYPSYHTTLDGNNNKLNYYYPTANDGYSFQVIAPKFRIVSFNNASAKHCTPKGAAMRCASLQEDGFPAGRWRLPTIAEIQFIIQLQKDEVIQQIFTSSGSMYATALYADAEKTKLVTLSLDNATSDKLNWNTPNSGISVRCVYDEWFWGSKREARQNQGNNVSAGDKYYFTWGDREITW